MKRFPRWYWPVLAAGVLAWLVAAYWLMPIVVRQAYHGDSLGVLNRMISGQERFEVEHYLELWAAVARLGTIVVLAGAALSAGLLWFRGAILRGVRRGWSAWFGAGRPRLAPAGIVAVAASFGLIAGFGELLYVLSRVWLGTAEPGMYHRAAIWMTPACSILVYGLVGVLVAGGARMRPAVGSVGLVVTVFGATCFYGLMRTTLGSVHPLAALVLSVGVALRLSAVAAPRTRRLTTGARWLAGSGALVVLVLVLAVQGGQHWRERWVTHRLPRAADGAPNILLLILDTVRAQDLTLYGYGRETTPQLARFAARGVVFDRAVAPASWTLPSHASVFTGRYPHELSAEWSSPLDDAYPTLAESLSDRGYATGGFVANTFFGNRYWGLQRGFQHWEVRPTSASVFVNSAWLGRKLFGRLVGSIAHERIAGRRNASQINAAFLKWLHGVEGGRPFFAFMNYMDAHEPYLPPAPWDRRFAPDRPRDQLEADGYEYGPEELRELNDAYDSGIAYLDHQLGRLFEVLDEQGVLDNTIVVVVGDHGEEFGEHDVRLVGHGESLYMPVLAVPLVIVQPNRVPAGVRIRRAVSIRDIATTVLELAGSGMPYPVAGEPLVSLWSADSGGAAPRSPLSELNPNVWTTLTWQPVQKGPMKSAVLDPFHCIRNGDGREELYDLDSDPWEQHDLSGVPANREDLERCRAALDQALGQAR